MSAPKANGVDPENEEPPSCFCNVPCQVFTTKSGQTYFKCNVKPDYTAIYEELKEAEDDQDREDVYLKHQLGCKMYSKIEDYPHLPIELFRRGPRNMPKCEHHDLYCKVGVSRDKKKVRAFFSCSAAFPDTPCNFFRWLKDYLPQQEQQPPEPPVYFPPQRQDLSAPPPAKRQRKRQPAPRPFFNNTNSYTPPVRNPQVQHPCFSDLGYGFEDY